MTSVIIQKRICVEPMFLDSNLLHYLLQKLKKTFINEITKENGYILEVKKIIKINDNFISSANSDIVFNVQFEALTLNPKIDDIYESKVFYISSCGIFVNIFDKIKILIPRQSMNEYELDEKLNLYFKQDKIIKTQDIIPVKVTAIKFNKKIITIIGNILE